MQKFELLRSKFMIPCLLSMTSSFLSLGCSNAVPEIAIEYNQNFRVLNANGVETNSVRSKNNYYSLYITCDSLLTTLEASFDSGNSWQTVGALDCKQSPLTLDFNIKDFPAELEAGRPNLVRLRAKGSDQVSIARDITLTPIKANRGTLHSLTVRDVTTGFRIQAKLGNSLKAKRVSGGFRVQGAMYEIQ